MRLHHVFHLACLLQADGGKVVNLKKTARTTGAIVTMTAVRVVRLGMCGSSYSAGVIESLYRWGSVHVDASAWMRARVSGAHPSQPTPAQTPVLDHRPTPPDFSTDGMTPLASAAFRGRLAAVRELLAAGADPTIRTRGGRTPMQLAEAEGHTKVAGALEKAEQQAAR